METTHEASDERQRRYTTEERARALARAGEVGPMEAARELGIPAGTLTHWAWKARGKSNVRTNGDEASQSRVDSAKDDAANEPQQKVVARRYTPSEKAEAVEYAATHGVSAAARKFGMTRFAIRDWRRKLALAAEGKGVSPTEGPAPSEVEARRDAEVLGEWHRQPGLGPSQVKNQLRRKGIKVSVHTVRRIMEDAGYRPPKVRRQVHDERFEAVRPNQLWHLDFVHRNVHKSSVFTLVLLDDYSRFAVGADLDDAERADLVVKTFEAAVARHGKPEMVLHDRGSAFWSWRGISRFTSLLVEMGIDQVAAEHKEWNGKLEVMNANLAKELFDVQRFASVADMRRRLVAHLDWYNHRRTHHALGGLLVPADRYYGRVDEVVARIESGAAADVHADALDIRERCLDLFRVASRGGQAEVWLLGKKIAL